MGGKAFKKRLVYSVAKVIAAQNNFGTLLKSSIVSVLKCKAHLKTKFKYIAMCYYVQYIQAPYVFSSGKSLLT